MSILSILAKTLATLHHQRSKRWILNPERTQQRVFEKLITSGKDTVFGHDHDFISISSYPDFVKRVPIRDYERLRNYFDRTLKGERNILWPGNPRFLAKTSGTTSGAKFIPITRNCIPNHTSSVRNAILDYVWETRKVDFLNGKFVFLSGSPELENNHAIPIGFLSGISNRFIPGYLRTSRLPSYAINCIADWEEKVDRMVEESLDEKITVISGVPCWVQMYTDKLREITGKPLIHSFPHLSLLIHSGMDFEPYKSKIEVTIGKQIDTLELYSASEGLFAYQDNQKEEGLLLVLDMGIFYEFVPAEELHKQSPSRLTLKEVEIGKSYAIIITSNAGLWAYNIGDVIQFVSKNPFRIVVSGRIHHYISAFGEHVISQEVDTAMSKAIKKTNSEVIDFHVAPKVAPKQGLPYHEWLVSFSRVPQKMSDFSRIIDETMQEQNLGYEHLITGNVLRPAVITKVADTAFIECARSEGKLGGQFKLPRLANDRTIADKLLRS